MEDTERVDAWTPRARDDVVFRSVAGDWVLYDPRSRDLHVLNVTAAAVWSCCDGASDPDAIALALGEHLEDVPEPEALRDDVRRTLERFQADGLFD